MDIEEQLFSGHRKVLDEIDGELNDYIQELELRFDEVIQERREESEDVFSFLKHYYMFIGFVADKGVFGKEHDGVKGIVAKISTDLHAILNCLKSGCIYQAGVILRSLFETTVNTSFIYQDFHKRIELYYNYKYVIQYKNLGDDVPISQQNIIKAKYHQVKNDYTGLNWYEKELKKVINSRSDLKRKKRKPNLRTMAIITGLEDYYNMLYKTLSFSVHGSSLLDHLFIEDNIITITPLFDTGLINTLSGLTVNCIHTSLVTVLKNSDDVQAEKFIIYLEFLLYSMMEIVLSKKEEVE